MKKILLLILPLLVVLCSCSQSIKYVVESPKNTTNGEKNGSITQKNSIQKRDGKCYKSCIFPDRYETSILRLPVYTGSDPDAPVRVEKLMVAPPRNQWVKMNTGEISLVQSPAQTREVRVLADTMFYKDFRYERFETKVLAEKGGFMRETEVVCSDERTPSLFLQISTTLKSYGYMEESTAQWGTKLNQAVQQFQKDNSLPVGDLNLETLQFMGI